jgi:hypothetical protein
VPERVVHAPELVDVEQQQRHPALVPGQPRAAFGVRASLRAHLGEQRPPVG